MRRLTALGLTLAASLGTSVGLACSRGEPGHLTLRILDGPRGSTVPARVELLDEAGRAWISRDALPLQFECIAAPLPEWAAPYLSRSDRILVGADGTEQFYLAGSGEVSLPAGRYQLRVSRGIEVSVEERTLEVEAGATTGVEIELRRWADMAAEGWWSVDDHVHITRRDAADDENIATWMAAEDLRVANLLQMGTVDQIDVTPQHDFGTAGEFRRGDTLLVAGQEHPRTHFFGHTITLGGDTLVDRRETYIDYATTFREALMRGAVTGYAHWGIGPARTGLALDAPRGLVFFLEVLQFDFPWYEAWYDLLSVGIRMTPTAGTDFPCGPLAGAPGRERFYVRLDEAPTRASMVAAIRAGRTFVTNGPLVDLHVGEAGIGGDVDLDAPGRVSVRARVRFDPERDDVQTVELIVNGVAQALEPRAVGPGELRAEIAIEIAESSWIALRVAGDKLGETPLGQNPGGILDWISDRAFDFREMKRRSEAFYAGRGRVRPSAAHTGAIYVTLPDSTPNAMARKRARAALERLAHLEARLGDDRIADQTLWDWIPYSDAVSEEHLRRNRPALLAAIRAARPYYERLLADPSSLVD